jgi:hypothetical protein
MRRLMAAMNISVLLMAVSCGSDSPEQAQDVSDEIPTTTLVMLDSIGVELGDSCYIFGSIEGLGYTPDGNIAVLDRISADIRLLQAQKTTMGSSPQESLGC